VVSNGRRVEEVETNKIESIVVIPNEGILIINGEKKERISKLYLEFINGRWVLSFEENKQFEATAPGWN